MKINRNLLSAVAALTFIFVFAFTTVVQAKDKYDDKTKDEKYAKVADVSGTLNLSFLVEWNEDAQQIMLQSNGISITLDSFLFASEDANPGLAALMQLIGGSDVLPINLTVPNLGFNANWDYKNEELKLSFAKKDKAEEKPEEKPVGPVDVTSDFIGRTITINSVQNNNYISARQDQKNAPLHASARNANNWERFYVADAGNGQAAFRANNGRYVSAILHDRNVPLRAEAGKINNWERFRIFEYNGNFYIQASNGQWVSAVVNSSNAPLRATATNRDQWERFIIR
ncbi:MAG: hypothetical protein FWB91_09475 [Defluviitaleaceae bacterium]|nr:hypothetical protein [Defluviitaleaceae bacterium]